MAFFLLLSLNAEVIFSSLNFQGSYKNGFSADGFLRALVEHLDHVITFCYG